MLSLRGARMQRFQYVASVLRITFKTNLMSNAFLTRVPLLRRGSWAMIRALLVQMDSIMTVPLFDQRVRKLHPSFKIAVSLVKQELITPRRSTVHQSISVIPCPDRLSSPNGSSTCTYCDEEYMLNPTLKGALEIFNNTSYDESVSSVLQTQSVTLILHWKLWAYLQSIGVTL